VRLATNLRLYRVFPFLRWRSRVNANSARADLLAGLTGAIVLLPQGVAFATIAGLPPEYGLYAAMVPAVIGAFFGSSWHLVTGPTTAISLVVFAAVSPIAEPGSAQYISLALTLSFLTGMFQLALGLARMGILVNFISHTVVVGFTAGAAVLIATSQIKNFFDLAIPRGTSFQETIVLLFEMIDQINPYATAVGLATLLCGILVGKYWPKLPYMIVAMLTGSLLALILDLIVGVGQTSIETVGALPRSLPPLSIPDLSLSAISSLLFSALAITLLGLTEAVSISRAIAVKSEQNIDTNQEFIGQGLANVVGSFFSAYPASGSFNRSGLNYASGAQTPLAAALASVLLLLILLAVAPLASYLPIATMAGVLFLVAYRLIDFHTILRIFRASKAESVVFSVTLVGTLLDLEKGIFVGMMLSLLLYLYRTSRPVIREALPAPGKAFYHFIPRMGAPGCPQLKMLFLDGAVFFGAVNSVETSLRRYDQDNPDYKHVLILGIGINFIDLAGAEMLAREARRRRRMGGGLYFHRLKDSVFLMLKSGGFIDDIGKANMFPMGPQVIPELYPRLDSEVCRRCKTRIFDECQTTLPNGEPRDE
jgi:SulP family sulfate permease